MPTAPAVSSVAIRTGNMDTCRSLAPASTTNSRTPRVTSTAATSWNTRSGANQTTATARAISVAPLSTRVIDSPSTDD